MPKLKTRKGVAKRFKFTKKKKILHPSSGKGHLLSGKRPRRLRRLRGTKIIEGRKERQYIRKMLPYG